MDITEEAKQFNPWYQTVVEDGKVIVKGHGGCGDPAWPFCKAIIPFELEGKRVLDLGANAGMHSIRAALEGANVVAVEVGDQYCDQFMFLQAYFENKYDKALQIALVKENVESMDFLSLGKFDVVLCNALLYHLGKLTGNRGKSAILRGLRDRLIENMCDVSRDVIITRLLRPDASMDMDNEIFEEFGFELTERTHKSRVFSLYRKGG